jgi:hypothetical protein
MMADMRFAAFIGLVLCGCVEGDFTPKTGQDRALQLVWHELYGMDSEPPAVEWVHEWEGDFRSHAVCGWKIVVADGPNGILHFSETSFAHELMHCREISRTGDVDAFHYRGDWNLANAEAVDALALFGL